MPLWFYDLVIYCLQLAVVILVGGLLLACARLNVPRTRLLYLKILLGLALLLPLVGPWRAMPVRGGDAGLDGVGWLESGAFGSVT